MNKGADFNPYYTEVSGDRDASWKFTKCFIFLLQTRRNFTLHFHGGGRQKQKTTNKNQMFKIKAVTFGHLTASRLVMWTLRRVKAQERYKLSASRITRFWSQYMGKKRCALLWLFWPGKISLNTLFLCLNLTFSDWINIIQTQVKFSGTCTLLEYVSVLLLYTFTLLHLIVIFFRRCCTN